MKQDSDQEASILEPSLGASDLRALTGLSYRQLNEWDKKGALAAHRASERSWRKVSWALAYSLRIVADLRDAHDISFKKQRELVRWIAGIEIDDVGLFARLSSQNMLTAFPSTVFPKGYIQKTVKVHSTLKHRSMLERIGAESLVSRGWKKDGAREFCSLYLRVSSPLENETWSIQHLHELQQIAEVAEDEIARRSVGELIRAVLPITRAMALIKAGFAVYLVSSPQMTIFIDEWTFIEWMRIDCLPANALMIRVNDSINSIRTTSGQDPFPVCPASIRIPLSDN